MHDNWTRTTRGNIIVKNDGMHLLSLKTIINASLPRGPSSSKLATQQHLYHDGANISFFPSNNPLVSMYWVSKLPKSAHRRYKVIRYKAFVSPLAVNNGDTVEDSPEEGDGKMEEPAERSSQSTFSRDDSTTHSDEGHGWIK
jgi:hypothetical protein